MKTVAILSQKGGAGKTTIAIHLAMEALRNKKEAIIIDLDPQASSTDWHDSREKDGPVVVSAQYSRLKRLLEKAKEEGVDLVIIDTAPHSEQASLESARNADLILIPCRPTILDLRAIGNTLDIAKIANTKAAVVLNTVPPRGTLATEAAEAAEGYGATICPVNIGNRSAFIHSLTAGEVAQEYEPKGKAADEINKLYKWVSAELN